MKGIKETLFVVISFVLIIGHNSCSKELTEKKYLTENVIVVVVDGPRYSETWGDIRHSNIPLMSQYISKSGIINRKFYNNGLTKTLAGHSSITTGSYQDVNNLGEESPMNPSFFQYWNKINSSKDELTWIIASKDKIEVMDNCEQEEFNGLYRPYSNCGIDGLGSGYRHDSTTYKVLIEVLNEYRPKLVLVNFKEPDYSAHQGNWDNYIRGIRSTDKYSYLIWRYIQENSNYQGKTTLFITNDHGRHLDDISNGFISHGDDCLGCRHINFFAYGPDFKQGVILDEERELIDIGPTISELLEFEMEFSEGEVMTELFK